MAKIVIFIVSFNDLVKEQDLVKLRFALEINKIQVIVVDDLNELIDHIYIIVLGLVIWKVRNY